LSRTKKREHAEMHANQKNVQIIFVVQSHQFTPI